MYNDEVGKYCRKFRRNILKKSLQQVAGDLNLKTLSAFEHGRSTNVNHIQKYVESCDSYEMQKYFIEGLVDTMINGECEY